MVSAKATAATPIVARFDFKICSFMEIDKAIDQFGMIAPHPHAGTGGEPFS
ncbi:MAG: hypothetical protein Fur005_18670 [Roseiflexaceae bacterium]